MARRGVPRLLWKLYLPISLLFLATLTLGLVFPWRGVFISFAAAFLGILVTVGYVDFVLREHEKSRWQATRERIYELVENIATISANQFRTAFGISADVYTHDLAVLKDPKRRRAETIRITKDVLIPSAREGIRALDTKKWEQLTRQMAITWQGADRILEVHGSKLEPELYSMILDLQRKMGIIKSTYEVWPDLIGVPDEALKPRSIETRDANLELIQRDVLEILGLSTRILEALDQTAGDTARRPPTT
jgi:hypothetical protein